MNTESPAKDQAAHLYAYAKDQLSHVYARINADHETRTTIKGWCVTVWVGSAVAASFNQVAIHSILKFLLPLLPIPLFWTLDAMYVMYVAHHAECGKKLEEMSLGLRPITPEGLREISLESSQPPLRLRTKFRTLFYGLIVYKSVSVFYATLVVITIVIDSLLWISARG